MRVIDVRGWSWWWLFWAAVGQAEACWSFGDDELGSLSTDGRGSAGTGGEPSACERRHRGVSVRWLQRRLERLSSPQRQPA